MKIYLAALGLLAATAVEAANPSFSDFAPFWYDTTGNLINAKNTATTNGAQTFYGNQYFKDKVGIGTNTPQADLHVFGSMMLGAYGFPPGITGSPFLISQADGSNFLDFYNRTSNKPWTWYMSGNDLRLYEDSLGYGTGGGGTFGDRFVFKDGGNVGIGTMAPAAKLEVNGATIVDGDTTVNGNVITRQVGIGIASPSALLHIYQPVALPLELFKISDPGYSNMRLTFSTGLYYSSIDNVQENMPSQPWPLIFNKTGGKVGIGTTTPATALEVSGQVRASDPIDPHDLATKTYVDSAVAQNNQHLYFSSVTNALGVGTSTNCSTMIDFPIAAAATNSIAVPTAGVYFLSRVQTNVITRIEAGPIDLETYIFVTGGGGVQTITAHPEIWVWFTNNTMVQIGTSGPQVFTEGSQPTLFNTTINISSDTNFTGGAHILLRWFADAVANSPTWNFVIGGVYDSHISVNVGRQSGSYVGSFFGPLFAPSFTVSSNAVSTVPAAPAKPGDIFGWVSNGYFYVLCSGTGATWTKTNLVATP